ncbi:MAG: hypothetical protein GXO74_00750 [Calditrichaeota bacterium]|nr:hypothetical protein [Calditrichota bacterium]
MRIDKNTDALSNRLLRDKTSRPEDVKTWFGLSGKVKVNNGILHRAGVIIIIPHPPIVNWFLRSRLAKSDKLTLSYDHEFGHLQTMPIFMIYLLLLFVIQWRIYRSFDWLNIVIIVIASHALWEFVSELSVIIKLRNSYFDIYRKKLINPIIFAFIMIGLNLIYWWKI